MSFWDKFEKINCGSCQKYFYKQFYKNHYKKCTEKKLEEDLKYKNKVYHIDYVVCGICQKPLGEINNFHLKTHNLNAKKYDELYPEFPRLIKDFNIKKNNYKILTKEISEKLKFSHTLEGYQKKYGIEDGLKRFQNSKKRKSFSHSLEWYNKKYGSNGIEVKKAHDKSRGVNLQKMIDKYGVLEGNRIYKRWLNGNTIKNYQNKYGTLKGLEFWFAQYEKSSKTKRKFSKIKVEEIDNYKKYCMFVNKFTRRNISLFKFNLENRGKGINKNHVDHKIPKHYGFLNNIPAEIIGSVYNLQLLTCSENCSKQDKYSGGIEVLIEKYNNCKISPLIINKTISN